MRWAVLAVLLLPGCASVDPWQSDAYDCRAARWVAQGDLPGLYGGMPPIPANATGDPSPMWSDEAYAYTGPEPVAQGFPRPAVPAAWQDIALWRFWWLSQQDGGAGLPSGFFVDEVDGHGRVLASYPDGTSRDVMAADLERFLVAATDFDAGERQAVASRAMVTDEDAPTRDFRTQDAARAMWHFDIPIDRFFVWGHVVQAPRPHDVVATGAWLFQLGGPAWALHHDFGHYRTIDIHVAFSDRVTMQADGGPLSRDAIEQEVERVLADHGARLVRDHLEIGFVPNGGCVYHPGPDDN